MEPQAERQKAHGLLSEMEKFLYHADILMQNNVISWANCIVSSENLTDN